MKPQKLNLHTIVLKTKEYKKANAIIVTQFS